MRMASDAAEARDRPGERQERGRERVRRPPPVATGDSLYIVLPTPLSLHRGSCFGPSSFSSSRSFFLVPGSNTCSCLVRYTRRGPSMHTHTHLLLFGPSSAVQSQAMGQALPKRITMAKIKKRTMRCPREIGSARGANHVTAAASAAASERRPRPPPMKASARRGPHFAATRGCRRRASRSSPFHPLPRSFPLCSPLPPTGNAGAGSQADEPSMGRSVSPRRRFPRSPSSRRTAALFCPRVSLHPCNL